MTIYENNMFAITIEKPIMSEHNNDEVMVYAITNKETGVRETETTALIRAKMEADAFMVQLEDYAGAAQFRQSQIEQATGNHPFMLN